VNTLRKAGRRLLQPVVKVGEKPGGEVREVHMQGGRYVSVLGLNPLFHHPTDTYPDAVDVDATVSVSRAAQGLALTLMDMATEDLPQAALAGPGAAQQRSGL